MRTAKALLILLMLALLPMLEAEQLSVNVPTGPVTVRVTAEGRTVFTGPDIQYLGRSGEPAIPYRIVRVLLPSTANIATVTATLVSPRMDEVAGPIDVDPIPPAATRNEQIVWPRGKRIVDGRDVDIYSAAALYPATLILSARGGQLRDWKLADVAVALFQYSPRDRKLYELKAGTLVIQFSLFSRPPKLQGAFGDHNNAEKVKKLVTNFEQNADSYRTTRPLEFVSRKPVYLIVTTQAIAKASTQLRSFIGSKRKRGFSVSVITEDTWGGGVGDIAAENLKRWLRSQYVAAVQVLDRRNISWDKVPKYMLLIGNPDPLSGDVPMKMLWPRPFATFDRESPSDFYYADLTGNWDLNGNGAYGEWNNDFGTGGVDLYPEILVGRIPFYGNLSDLDKILSKIVRFENADAADATWRKNILLPMKPSDVYTPGYQLGEEVKNTVLINKRWAYHRIYDEQYGLVPPPETTPVTVQNVADVWTTTPFGGVFWWTHGWSEGAVDIMDIWHTADLDDSHPSFTFQASCTNSMPEDTSNLSYSLLLNGAISAIGATRVSWYWIGQTVFDGTSSNSGMTLEYAKRLITNEMDTGTALYDVKQTVSVGDPMWPDNPMWMNFTGFNIYGDPSVGLFTSK